MMKISSLFILLLSINILFGQKTFQRVYSGKMFLENTKLTSDGGAIVVGKGSFDAPYSDEKAVLHDAGIVKLGSDYEVEWARYFTRFGVREEDFRDVIEWGDHYYALGMVKDSGFKTVLTKLDKNGEEVWTKMLPSIGGTDLRLKLLDGQLYAVVHDNVNNNGGFYVFNRNGEVIENRFFALGLGNVQLSDMIEHQGEFYLVGNAVNNDGNRNFILGKLDSDRNVLWIKEYKSSYLDGSRYYRKMSLIFEGGNLYFSNHKSSADSGNEDVVVFKLSQDGELLLSKQWGNGPLTIGNALTVHDNKFYLGYSVAGESGSAKCGMMILNENIEVEGSFGYAFDDHNLTNVHAIYVEDDGVIMCGVQYLHYNDYDGFYLIKTNFEGRTSCIQFSQFFDEKEVTNEYEESDLSFEVLNRGYGVIDFQWDSTYTANDSVLYNCEKEYFYSRELTEGPYCGGDTVKLEQYIPKGELVSWEIPFEDMIEETESYVSFVVREDSLIEAVAEFSGEVYEMKLSLGCPPGSDLIVNQTWSPNNDGVNDYFEIKNLDYYPSHKVLLINKFGDKVFEQQNYQNNWQGDGLTNGVYQYFIFKDNNDLEPEKGVIIVNY